MWASCLTLTLKRKQGSVEQCWKEHLSKTSFAIKDNHKPRIYTKLLLFELLFYKNAFFRFLISRKSYHITKFYVLPSRLSSQRRCLSGLPNLENLSRCVDQRPLAAFSKCYFIALGLCIEIWIDQTVYSMCMSHF